jgi:hypothetical protein
MSDQPFGPRPTGKPPVVIDITGYLMPGILTGPLIVRLGEGPELYVLVFSDEKKLRDFCQAYGLPCEKIKQVKNQHVMLASLDSQGIHCAIDARKDADGVCRWLEVGVPS